MEMERSDVVLQPPDALAQTARDVRLRTSILFQLVRFVVINLKILKLTLLHRH